MASGRDNETFVIRWLVALADKWQQTAKEEKASQEMQSLAIGLRSFQVEDCPMSLFEKDLERLNSEGSS